jgi:hypothetical protein
MRRSWQYLSSWEAVAFIVASVWAFGGVMVGTGDFIAAKILFFLGNLILATKIITSPNVDYDQRQTIVFFVLLGFVSLSGIEWVWIEEKIAVARINDPKPIQAVAVPASISKGSDGTHVGSPSTPRGILPPTSAAVPLPRAVRQPTRPRPKVPQEKPTQEIISPDPYIGITDSKISEWAIQEADRLDGDSQKCMNMVFDSANEKSPVKGTPVLIQTPKSIQWEFQLYFRNGLKPSIVKLHDSLVFRLGPALLDPDEESTYNEMMRIGDSPKEWPFLCAEVKSYVLPLRLMGQRLMNQR